VSEEKVKKMRPIRCVVTSDKMNKSRVGSYDRIVKHDRYSKYRRRRTKVTFHDETNESRVGDEVLVTSCRPISKRKKFNLLQVVRKTTEA